MTEHNCSICGRPVSDLSEFGDVHTPLCWQCKRAVADMEDPLDALYRRTAERQNAPDGAMTAIRLRWAELNGELSADLEATP